jgi:hypothetical protein
MNITKTMVLKYHYLYNKPKQDHKEGDRTILKITGSGWNTSDLFKDYFVIHEAKYVKAQKYTEIDVKQLTIHNLEHACFAFNGMNQVNCQFISTHKVMP